jgi:hypothetical protein
VLEQACPVQTLPSKAAGERCNG